MTTTVAFHVPRKGTWIGSDGLATSAYNKVHLPPGMKWIVKNGIGWGLSGSIHCHTVLKQNEDLFPADASKLNPYTFANEFRELLRDDGYTFEVEEGEPCSISSTFLLATAHNIWVIDSQFSVWDFTHNRYCAIGSGSHYALGAWRATKEDKPEALVRKTIEVAGHFDPSTGGETFTQFLPMPKAK